MGQRVRALWPLESAKLAEDWGEAMSEHNDYPSDLPTYQFRNLGGGRWALVRVGDGRPQRYKGRHARRAWLSRGGHR